MQKSKTNIDSDIQLNFLSEKELQGRYPHWFSDPAVCQFNQHAKFSSSHESCKHYIESIAQSKTDVVWAVYHSGDNLHIGNIALQSINWLNRTAEIALIFGEKAYWGKGYATLAAQYAISHAFEKLNLNRIYCATAATNIAMLKLAKKLGFSQEGERREALFLNGGYVNSIEFGILKHDYNKQREKQ